MIELVATASVGSTALSWLTIIVVALLFFAVRAQLNPFTRCKRCGGRPPSDTAGGNYHRCPRCKGASERLRFGALVMRAVGIPVPRARPGAKSNRWGL